MAYSNIAAQASRTLIFLRKSNVCEPGKCTPEAPSSPERPRRLSVCTVLRDAPPKPHPAMRAPGGFLLTQFLLEDARQRSHPSLGRFLNGIFKETEAF